MFGCIGGLFRLVFFVVVPALLGGVAYYYLKPHPVPWPLFNEALMQIQLAGCVLVLVGVWLTGRRR